MFKNSLQKLIYKDEVYFVERKYSKLYTQIENFLYVYIKRTGFWSFLFPYKRIIKEEIRKSDLEKDYYLIKFIDNWLFPKERASKTLVIDCSPEITTLFKNEK